MAKLGIMGRVSIGIPGADKLCDGGIPKGEIVHLVGAPGTGKTEMCIQFCESALMKGLNAVYVCIEQDEEDIIAQAQLFGCFMGKQPIMISSKKIKYGMGKKPDDLEQTIQLLIEELTRIRPDVIAIDSISSLQIEDGVKARLMVKKLFEGLRKTGATSIVTGESLNGEYTDKIAPFLAGGLIMLTLEVLGGEARAISIRKMRKTKIDPSPHTLEFTKKGLVVTE
jgi:KaiC/GvpD/RAD55 family RecA-like ATPase